MSENNRILSSSLRKFAALKGQDIAGGQGIRRSVRLLKAVFFLMQRKVWSLIEYFLLLRHLCPRQKNFSFFTESFGVFFRSSIGTRCRLIKQQLNLRRNCSLS